MQDEGVPASDHEKLVDGDPEAIDRLWAAYFQRLVALARKMLPSRVRRVVDEEDVALSAFQSFCEGAASGRFPKLDDPEDLWRLLVVITFRKVRRAVRYGGTHKRGGDRVRGESVFISGENNSVPSGLAEMLGEGPTPELAAELAEQCDVRLGQLGNDELRSIALLKMEGYTVDEIALQLGCARRSVERRLQTIREIWGEALSQPN